mgnify:CR=1 FL=1
MERIRKYKSDPLWDTKILPYFSSSIFIWKDPVLGLSLFSLGMFKSQLVRKPFGTRFQRTYRIVGRSSFFSSFGFSRWMFKLLGLYVYSGYQYETSGYSVLSTRIVSSLQLKGS